MDFQYRRFFIQLLYLYWCLAISISTISGQKIQVQFNHLTQENGLSQGVNAYIFKDSRGYIWISSVNGLNRFNGQKVKSWFPIADDSTAIANGLINSSFYEDSVGDIWFSCNTALQRYIRSKDQFETIFLKDDIGGLIPTDIMVFHLDEEHRLWIRVGVGEKGRLHLYNTRTRDHEISYPLDGQRCNVISGSDGNIQGIISSMFESKGFHITHHPEGRTEKFFKEDSENPRMTYNFWVQNEKVVWFGSDGNLIKYNLVDNQYEIFDPETNPGRIWSIHPWNDYLVMGSSLGGILFFDRTTHTFGNQIKANEVNRLRQNEVSEIYIDNHDVLWASLWWKGIDYASLKKIKFNSIADPRIQLPILSIVESVDGNIYGTGPQLNFALDHTHLEVITPPWKKGIVHTRSPRLFQDKNNHIWYSDHTLRLIEPVGNQIENEYFLPDPANDLLVLSSGRTLVSTNEGIIELIPEKKAMEPYFFPELESHRGIAFSQLYEDKYGILYCSKNSESLMILDANKEPIKKITEITGLDQVKAFLEPKDYDSLWIATSNGILVMDQKSFKYRYLNLNDGLPAELYYSLLEDDGGIIWMSSNNGIVRYDPELKVHRRYSTSDGLISREFNTNSYLQASDGTIWFGGTNGLNYFDPKKIQDLNTLPQVQIIDYWINDEKYPSDSSISEKQMLELNHQSNTISIEFTGLEYSDPSRNQFRYRLIGLEDNWIDHGTKTFVRYPNLAPGLYTFEVMGSNADLVWNTQKPARLNIKIQPAFTQTKLFYGLMSLTGLGILFFIYRFQVNRKMANAEKKRLRELDELKNKMFANITHEFRTPLTLITGPVSYALASNKSLDKASMNGIIRNGKRLLNLVNQILDLQKIKAEKLSPSYIYGDITEHIHYLVSAFNESAHQKGIKLTYQKDTVMFMDFDEDMLTQITSNLISNALRHTKRNGKISVRSEALPNNKSLLIKIQDTGVGIPAQELPYIFDEFYQSSYVNNGGTGIGLTLTKKLVHILKGEIAVESTLDFGTTFHITLPIQHSAENKASGHERIITFPQHHSDEERFAEGINPIPDLPLILIIEDEPEIAEFIEKCLLGKYQTIIAHNGVDGYSMAFKFMPELIISDIRMPRKDGLTLCHELKTDIRTSHIPVILLTGKTDKESTLAGLEFGADDYITKPFDAVVLLARIAGIIQLRANLRQYYLNEASDLNSKTSTVEPSARENQFLQKIRETILSNLEDPQFNMQMLCQTMAMSHSQLHRKLKALTGESMIKFVQNTRMAKAKDLLTNSEFSIAEIAYQCGFSDPGYFTKNFKTKYGHTPTSFRNL